MFDSTGNVAAQQQLDSSVGTPRVLPRNLLYSIFARIGGHGLDTDSFEALRASRVSPARVLYDLPLWESSSLSRPPRITPCTHPAPARAALEAPLESASARAAGVAGGGSDRYRLRRAAALEALGGSASAQAGSAGVPGAGSGGRQSNGRWTDPPSYAAAESGL